MADSNGSHIAKLIEHLTLLGDSDDAPSRAEMLMREQMRSVEDPRAFVQEVTQQLKTAAIHPINRLSALWCVATFCRTRAQASEDLADIDLAINVRQVLLSSITRDDPSWSDEMVNLGNDQLVKFSMSGRKEDLQSSIDLFRDALGATETPLGRSKCLRRLGDALIAKFEKYGLLADLDLSIEKLQASLELLPKDFRYRDARLQALGHAWQLRYNATSVREDLEQSKRAYQGAIEETEQSDLDRAQTLAALGDVLYHMFTDRAQERSTPGSVDARHQDDSKEADALHKAIEVLQKSLDMTTPGFPARRSRVSLLGYACKGRYELNGSETDLENAIKAFEEALRLAPKGFHDLHVYHELLGHLYAESHRKSGTFNQLQLAIDHYNNFLESTQDDHASRALDLFTIGDLYFTRFQSTGDLKDLDMLIMLSERGLGLSGANEAVRRSLFSSLANGYVLRHKHVGASADIDAAIRASLEGLKISSESDGIEILLFMSLGMAYDLRYGHTRLVGDLDLGIQNLQEAHELVTKATTKDISMANAALSNLANAYRTRFSMTEQVSDIDRAIELLQDATETETTLYRPELHKNLSDSLLLRYSSTQNPSDLERALVTVDEALKRTPQNHPFRPRLVASLAAELRRDQLSSPGALNENTSEELLQEVLNHPTSSPSLKLRIGHQLMRQYVSERSLRLAYKTAVEVVSSIPLLVPQSLESSDKQRLIINAVGMASDAAAISLLTGNSPYEAIRLLELGRGVIQTSLNIVRADVSELQAEHPHLAQSFTELQDKLDAPISLKKPSGTMSLETWTRQASARYNASRDLDGLLFKIRQLPTFERFLLGPSEGEILAAAHSGPIVIVNASEFRCDALIVLSDGIRPLWLPRLLPRDIEMHARDLDAHRISIVLLEWLWKVIAKPVLAVLGYEQTPPGDTWPRICWIPTGLLTKFPIHAAGLYRQDDVNNTNTSLLDRAISNYSSSIRTLVEGRQTRKRPDQSSKPKVAAFIGAQHGLLLPYVGLEKRMVTGIYEKMNLQVLQPAPHRLDVLSVLNQCDIFHFAGHGKADSYDPSRSALQLSDEPLTVDSLYKINHRHRKPFLAYLSACGTGQNNNTELIDEGVHLIAACQLAGFQNVIGTLWQVDDQSSVDVAVDTYDWMRKHDMNQERLSEGLHHACRSLRARWVQESSAFRGPCTRDVFEYQDGSPTPVAPLHWVPYVLYGY